MIYLLSPLLAREGTICLRYDWAARDIPLETMPWIEFEHRVSAPFRHN